MSLIVTLGHTYLLLRSCSVSAFWNKLPLFLALRWVPRRLSGSAGGFTGTGCHRPRGCVHVGWGAERVLSSSRLVGTHSYHDHEGAECSRRGQVLPPRHLQVCDGVILALVLGPQPVAHPSSEACGREQPRAWGKTGVNRLQVAVRTYSPVNAGRCLEVARPPPGANSLFRADFGRTANPVRSLRWHDV